MQSDFRQKGTLKVCYGASQYRSFARVAKSYNAIIGRKHKLVQGIQEADIIVLHCEPQHYKRIYETFPFLSHKYVIGCATWEASHLPPAFEQGLQLIQEVWTCSRYCFDIFRSAHSKVALVPHVIQRDTAYTEEDIKFVKERIGYRPDINYSLLVTRMQDRRKNVHTLLEAFRHFHASEPSCRLIVKGVESDVAESQMEGARILTEGFSETQLNALYSLSSIYVSAHHSEGWGLTMSDAMLFKIPVVATGYSGNLDYMDADSAFLIPSELRTIEERDRTGLFSGTMKWAYSSSDEIVSTLREAFEGISSGETARKTRNASRVVERYTETEVASLIYQRLELI